MKLITQIVRLGFLTLLLNYTAVSKAQSKFRGQGLAISVTGTSSLHDWEMKSGKAQCDAIITVGKDKIVVSTFNFSLPVESLKSGHGMMDKNTYKAMDTKKHPDILFQFSTTTSITQSGKDTYTVKGTGKLTIAGTTKLTDMVATLRYDAANKTFNCTGTKKLKMSEYGVKPPTAMMGTIKTGDNIAISYNINIKG